MDREAEKLQFLGLLGIYKESFNIILSWPKIFTKITLLLILPLTFFFLFRIHLSQLVLFKINHNLLFVFDEISFDWNDFMLLEVAYHDFVFTFSFLSTSAVVYSITSIYTTGKAQLTFKKVITVDPKVRNRFGGTFFLCFIIIVVALVFSLLTFVAINPRTTTNETALLFLPLFLNFNGLVYICFVWHLASVISVLEDFRGIEAMIKCKALVKGKMRVALAIYFKLTLALMLIQSGFEKMVVNGEQLGMKMWMRVLSGIVCFLLLMQLLLFGVVVQSVFYFVCKSYHHESIDISILADHLGAM